MLMVGAIIQSKDLSEALSYWATTGGILIAVVAGLAAYWKYHRDQAQHEWDQARQSYQSFIELAMNYPQFAPGYWTREGTKDAIGSNQYRWFIARFLWACEEILTNRSNDPVWRGSLRITMVEHADYFASPTGRNDNQWYYQSVRDLIEEAILEARGEGGRMPSIAGT